MHLTCICVGEFADLENDDHETAELAMEKEKVEPVPLVTDAQPLLSADESEVAAKLKEKMFKMKNQSIFESALGVLVFESEKLEDVRVFKLFFGREHFAGLRFFTHL